MDINGPARYGASSEVLKNKLKNSGKLQLRQIAVESSSSSSSSPSSSSEEEDQEIDAEEGFVHKETKSSEASTGKPIRNVIIENPPILSRIELLQQKLSKPKEVIPDEEEVEEIILDTNITGPINKRGKFYEDKAKKSSSESSASESEEEDQPDFCLKFKLQGEVSKISFDPSKPLKLAFEKFIEIQVKKGNANKKFTFKFDGDKLNSDQSAIEHQLENEDQIDVHAR